MATCSSADSILEAAALIKANGGKINRFTNGTDTETVQLGSGPATPVLRNVVRQMLSAGGEIEGTDASGKFVLADGGTEARTLASRFADGIVPEDFGAAGDGTTSDDSAFAALEASVSGRMVDLCGLRYAVASIPSKNYYYNGAFVVSDRDYPAYLSNIFSYYNPDGITGSGVGNGDLNYFICDGWSTPESIQRARESSPPHLKDVIAIGNLACNGAIKNDVYLNDTIALGSGVMSSGQMTSQAEHNIGIGQFALRDITSGHRNIAIGSLAFVCSETLTESIAIGRDAGQTIMSGENNVLLGYGVISGLGATIGIDGKIRSATTQDVESVTAIGALSMQRYGVGTDIGSFNIVSIGTRSAQNLKKGSRSVFIGTNVCRALDSNSSHYNKLLVEAQDEGTYTASGTSAVVEISGHSAEVGRYVKILFSSGPCAGSSENQILYVASVSGSNFTLTLPVSVAAGSGTCTVSLYETSTDGPGDAYCCAVVGSDTLVNAKRVYASTVVAGCSLNKQDAVVELSVIIGDRISDDITRSLRSVIIGHSAGPAGEQTNADVFIGTNAGHVFQGSTSNILHNTAVGYNAMYTMTDGTASVSSCENTTAIGYEASVSGSNQVQLGNSATTTYAFGAVQDRSDARDKADIRDTALGLDFLLSLRPVDFRWDYRDDYIDIVEREVPILNENNETVIELKTEVIKHEKDGSRKRSRFHHGLIAQEVKAVLDEKGIDFGGYQDHKINGGKDVLSLGYEEFIGPIIKAIQEIDSRLKALEA